MPPVEWSGESQFWLHIIITWENDAKTQLLCAPVPNQISETEFAVK